MSLGTSGPGCFLSVLFPSLSVFLPCADQWWVGFGTAEFWFSGNFVDASSLATFGTCAPRKCDQGVAQLSSQSKVQLECFVISFWLPSLHVLLCKRSACSHFGTASRHHLFNLQLCGSYLKESINRKISIGRALVWGEC